MAAALGGAAVRPALGPAEAASSCRASPPPTPVKPFPQNKETRQRSGLVQPRSLEVRSRRAGRPSWGAVLVQAQATLNR